ncbi:hypothetical protein L1887_50228 [Cichorium endivia]|nr:hypothetical protein L1887_50228 [Cichorium endivia]
MGAVGCSHSRGMLDRSRVVDRMDVAAIVDVVWCLCCRRRGASRLVLAAELAAAAFGHGVARRGNGAGSDGGRTETAQRRKRSGPTKNLNLSGPSPERVGLSAKAAVSTGILQQVGRGGENARSRVLFAAAAAAGGCPHLSHSDVTLRPVALHPTHIQGAWSFSFPWLCSSICSALSQSAGWTP